MDKTIRIGTRGSKLALWQAEYIAGLIKPSGFRTEIIPIDTKGDHILDVAISKIGSKGVFTEEIEAKLLDGSIDIAVHSAKDLASELPEELELIAFSEREAVNDVVVSHKKINITTDKLKIGTSATRRVAFLKHFYPNVEAIPVRGNLVTRVAKLRAGECDALLLAYAGIHRLGIEDLFIEKIETSYFVPAVGQGSIAIECHKKLPFAKKEVLERWVNHPQTENCIRAERAFLKTLHGGCSIPAFGYAHYEGDMISLKAGLISLDGQRVIKVKRSSPAEDVKELGEAVAREVLINGGEQILKDIRQQLHA